MTTTAANANMSTTPCPGCGGSGQIAFFRGVSRFVMDWDDCPDCCGTGLLDASANEAAVTDVPSEQPEQAQDHTPLPRKTP